MVLVGVTGYHVVQILGPVVLQIGIHQVGVLGVATVNEHVVAVADHQGGVRLAHINEVDLKAAPLSGRGGLPLAVEQDIGRRQKQHDKQENHHPARLLLLSSSAHIHSSNSSGSGRRRCSTGPHWGRGSRCMAPKVRAFRPGYRP